MALRWWNVKEYRRKQEEKLEGNFVPSYQPGLRKPGENDTVTG